MSDDENQYDPKSHKSLLQAINNLQKSQHIRKATRNELRDQHDEFQLVKGVKSSTNTKKSNLAVGDVVQVLKKTKKHLDTGKLLKNVQSTKKVLEKPLEKTVTDRIRRTIAYDKVKKNLERWDAIVTKNRSSETQVFPLQSETIYVDTSAHAKPFQASLKSDLMLEMEESEAKLKALKKQRLGDTTDEKELEKAEMLLLKKKMTRDELMAKRRELAYLKMRESQKSAKARLQNKIKSKKYHKLLKRQKLQEQIKQFELLQKTNPEAALEKLNEIEKSRVLERANLRHKNTGSWAKNLQIRAKYDKDVRKDLAEQLQISRQLTQKKTDSDDEESENDVEIKQEEEDAEYDPFNPWTKSKTDANKDNKNVENEPNWRKYWLERNANEKLLEEYKKEYLMDAENNEADEISIDEEIEIKTEKTDATQSNEKLSKSLKDKPMKANKKITKTKSKTNAKKLNTKSKTKVEKADKKVKIENGWIVEEVEDSVLNVEESIDDIFDAKEDEIRIKLNKKLNAITKQANALKKQQKKTKKIAVEKKNALKNLEDLTFNKQATRPIIDEELNAEEDEHHTSTIERKTATNLSNNNDNITTKSTSTHTAAPENTIDPNKLASIKLNEGIGAFNIANEALDDADLDDVDENMPNAHQMTIAEAFEDDDIVADFTKEKTQDAELKNTELQLSMPGWGSWAGAGISQEKQINKNKRLILKLAAEEKRRDENKKNIYINEEVNKNLRTHLVSDLPFPFTSLKDYEASIRAPLGRNFLPETAFRMLTRPSVITRKGQVIEPMDESELIKAPRKLRNVVDRRIESLNKAMAQT